MCLRMRHVKEREINESEKGEQKPFLLLLTMKEREKKKVGNDDDAQKLLQKERRGKKKRRDRTSEWEGEKEEWEKRRFSKHRERETAKERHSRNSFNVFSPSLIFQSIPDTANTQHPCSRIPFLFSWNEMMRVRLNGRRRWGRQTRIWKGEEDVKTELKRRKKLLYKWRGWISLWWFFIHSSLPLFLFITFCFSLPSSLPLTFRHSSIDFEHW